MNEHPDKSLEAWIWDAACSIRGAKDAPKYKDYILPLIFTKRLCDVFDDELNRIAAEVGSRAKAFQLVRLDKSLVRFYLPENLFYNTSAPGILLFLNKAKPEERREQLFLLNASKEFVKGDPKNYIPDESIRRIADAFLKWREEEKFSRIVGKAEIVKNDYNISPSRYIHTGDAEEYRPLTEIVEELDLLETETAAVNAQLHRILGTLGVGSMT